VEEELMERFFQYLNIFPMPLWLAMMFAPNHPLTERLSRPGPLFIIAGLNYVVALALAVRRGQREGASLDFTSLEGIRKGLSSPEGAAAAWAHMLALDLFSSAWIYRECRRLNAPARVRIPSLFATLMAGPAGLMGFLIWRLRLPAHHPPADDDP
jgi:hypothetical protein